MILVALLFGAIGAEEKEKLDLYLDVKEVNVSESLQKIAHLPIVYYKFLHDSVADRVQLGAIGTDAQRLFPDSIDVLPSATFTNMSALASGGRPTTYSVRNYPIVDKNVLFMHGLAALQELIHRYESLQTLIGSLGDRDQSVYNDIRNTQRLLEESISRQIALRLRAAETEAATLLAKAQREKEREEEEREKAQQRLAEEKTLLAYEANLARERLAQQEETTRETVAAQLRLEREMSERKERLQRETAQNLQTLRETKHRDLEAKRLEFEKEKIRVEIEARSQQNRVQEEIQIKKIQMQAELDTERMVQGIKNISQQISFLTRNLLAQPRQLLLLGGLFLALVFCYYLVREMSALLRQMIQHRLGRPALVRETSYHWSLLPSFLTKLGEPSTAKLVTTLEQDFADIILSAPDKERILHLALATRNTKRAMAPYRHVLLHGPPGTGKTLIARRLAQSSGMDYAILSGGDVAPLGEDAVNQLHALFKWAQQSRRGLLLFIDEAEAFLSSRAGGEEGNGGNSMNSNGAGNSSHLRNALNALLYQTGTPSTSFMMVLATNRPQDLDPAVLDRVDVSLQIGLPQAAQRAHLIQHYFAAHVVSAATRSQTQVARQQYNPIYLLGRALGLVAPYEARTIESLCFEEMAMQEMVRLTTGFSGREIAKLFVAVQYVLLLSATAQLTWVQLRGVVLTKAEEHRVKSSGFRVEDLSEENDMELRAKVGRDGNGGDEVDGEAEAHKPGTTGFVTQQSAGTNVASKRGVTVPKSSRRSLNAVPTTEAAASTAVDGKPPVGKARRASYAGSEVAISTTGSSSRAASSRISKQ